MIIISKPIRRIIENQSTPQQKADKNYLKVILIILLTILITAGVVYFVMNQQIDEAKNSANKTDNEKVAELEKQVKEQIAELEEQSGQPAESGQPAVSGYAGFKQFCASKNNAAPFVYYVNNDGEFGTCTLGQAGMLTAKKVNGNWTELASGQQLSDESIQKLNANKVPAALYKTDCN